MKLGVLTLVLACVVICVWVDSFNGDLTFDVNYCSGMVEGTSSIGIFQHAVELRETRSTRLRVSNIQNLDPATLGSYVRMTVIFEDSDQSSDSESPATAGLGMPELGQDILSVDGDSTTLKRSETMYFETLEKMEKVFSIPLWSVAIPLTLLSAWLLLSTPRVAKPN